MLSRISRRMWVMSAAALSAGVTAYVAMSPSSQSVATISASVFPAGSAMVMLPPQPEETLALLVLTQAKEIPPLAKPAPFVEAVLPVLPSSPAAAPTKTARAKQPTHLARLTAALKELANGNIKTGAAKNAWESAGECAGHIVTALNRADIAVTMADADKLQPELIKAGFQPIDMTHNRLQPGDIVFIAPLKALQEVQISIDKRGRRHETHHQIDEAHPFGHVMVYTTEGMISDFVQGDLAVPYKHRQHVDPSDITVLRHPVLAQEAEQTPMTPAEAFKETAAADLARAKLGWDNAQYTWNQASVPQNYNAHISSGSALLSSYNNM